MTAEYQALPKAGVRHLASGATVLPTSLAWEVYVAYLAAGGEILPAEAELPTADEMTARAENDGREATRAILSADAALRALRNRTPAQVDAWIDANVVDLASARQVLKILARVCALIARERL